MARRKSIAKISAARKTVLLPARFPDREGNEYQPSHCFGTFAGFFVCNFVAKEDWQNRFGCAFLV
jgi:hypothetical protein